jgi:hypothetical protein
VAIRRFVQVKTQDQLDIQATHHVRDRMVPQCAGTTRSGPAEPSVTAMAVGSVDSRNIQQIVIK